MAEVRIGYLGADGHGKSSLMAAVAQCTGATTITVSYDEYAEFYLVMYARYSILFH